MSDEERICPLCANFHDEGEVCPKADERPFTFNKDGRQNIWWYLIAFPLLCIFWFLYMCICVFLTIFVHPEERRKRWFEYYFNPFKREE